MFIAVLTLRLMNKQFLAKYRIESDEFLSKFSLSIIRFNASASSKD